MSKHGNWRKGKPNWWPEEVAFRSPNIRNPALVREELDWILKAAHDFTNAICVDDGINGDEMVGESSPTHEPVCRCKEHEACAAGMSCCMFSEVPLPDNATRRLSCIVCATCRRHYHRLCRGEDMDDKSQWHCGCTVNSSQLTQ